MQKPNPVIKNYILSPEVLLLDKQDRKRKRVKLKQTNILPSENGYIIQVLAHITDSY